MWHCNILFLFLGFLIAVLDRAHLKLKMEYKQKKKIQKKLEIAIEKNIYYKVHVQFKIIIDEMDTLVNNNQSVIYVIKSHRT